MIRRNRRTIAICWLLLLAVALSWDRAGWLHVSLNPKDPAQAARLAVLQSRDWYRLLRIAGYFPTWLVVGAALVLAEHSRRERGLALPGAPSPLRRGTLVVLAAGVSGLAAEAFKFVVGRVRPEDSEGWNRLWGLGERWSRGSDLSMPSSHAAVAFGAAFMLGRLYPGLGWLALPLAAGCGLTRVLAGAHFVSDVVAAAILGWAACAAIWAWDARNNSGSTADRA
ncbi:MAG: phosphatase PAP2 family protein [Phycisphaeraceae bacterium]|nr:phosphatase PAP2 family protein [Phycisphaeraceae bacterium]